MKTKKILALWAFGMLAILTIFCYGQGHTIRQFPTTNQLANADAFVVELGTGTTNMNVTKANMPGALGVPTLAQMLAATNDSFAYAFSLSNRVVTSAGTANVSNNLTASNLWDRSNVKWWGAKGDGTTDDTVAISNAVRAASAVGGTLYFPAGKYLNTKPIGLTNGITISGDYPILRYVTNQVPDQLTFTPNGGTWLDFGGTNGFYGHGLRGLKVENIGITNFYKAFSFGADSVEGAPFSVFRNIIGLGNPTVNMSEIGLEIYNSLFVRIDAVKFYAVNTGLRFVQQWENPEGNSVIEDFYVFTYPKSVANANNTKAGMEILCLTPTVGSPLMMNSMTFIRPQVNSFNGDSTGIGIRLLGTSLIPAAYIMACSIIDADIEGPLAYAIYIDYCQSVRVSIATDTATPGCVYLGANGYNHVVQSAESGTIVTNVSPSPNLFFGHFSPLSTTNTMYGTYYLAGGVTYICKAGLITGKMQSDASGYVSPNVDGTGTASYHPGGLYAPAAGGNSYIYSPLTTFGAQIASVGSTWVLATTGNSFLNGGNVGVGTNAPQAALHVIGNNTTSNILTLGVTNADLKARVDTNGNVFANKYYGDGSTLTGIGAASTNVAMISAGWVEAGGGHFTNDLSVDGTMRVNTLNVGTLVVTSCPAFTVGNLNVVTNANVATLTASNNATFLAGATFVTAVTSSADSASNAPAANEFPNASWVRGLFNNGAILYAGPGVRTDATNDSSGQFMYLFTNTIPATSSRKYAIPNAGDYVGGVMTSNALTFVQGPIYVHAFLQSSNGNGGQSISVHPEIYYSYDRTNWQGDFSANDQVIATGTNLYEWVISFPAITSTNSIGFWIERRFKVGAATGATHPDLYFHLGTNFASGINDASHISFSGPSSGTGNAYLANDQTFTGSNTFNGAINAASNINANRITATNRLTIGPTGTGTTFSNNAGILTIRDVAGQTVGVIDNDATLGTAFWIISTPTSNSMAAAITADTNKAAMAIGGGHVTNKVTIDGNLEFTTGLLAGDANVTNYTLIAGTNDVYIGKSNVNIVAIMGGVAGKATPMSIVITNGTGVSWGISFSAVTNAWHWPYSQGAPTVLTNATQLLINLRLDGSNVLAAWAAYAWP